MDVARLNCSRCGAPLTVSGAGQVIPCASCTLGEVETHTAVPKFNARREAEVRPPANSSMLVAVVLAAMCSLTFYIPLMLFGKDTYLYALFCGHDWVPYVATFLFFCALWILLLKWPRIVSEEGAFSLQLLPEDDTGVIEAADSHKILNRISRLTPRQQKGILANRIRQALLRLNQLGTSEKVDDMLRYRSEADIAAMDSSYAAPKFIIWAIPVLGFVGTVIGISKGVSNFSAIVQSAASLDGLRESLKGVTSGLGQAFETTMVALCMSLVLMLIQSILQRREDQLLARIDEYCVEHLLHKVRFPPSGDELKVNELVAALAKLGDRLERLHASPDSKASGS